MPLPPRPLPLPEKRPAAKSPGFNWKPLAEAAGLFTLGMLTHQLPVRARPGRSLLPTDWKAYFRIATGIVVANRLNKAFNWEPPPWLAALEAVTVINPLALGVSIKSLAHYVVMAPLVAAMVQAANVVNRSLGPPLKDHFEVPPLAVRLAVSVAFGVLGVVFYPKLFKKIADSGILGKTLSAGAAQGVLAGSAGLTCARGCSPGSIICLSEAAELLGGLGNWVQQRAPVRPAKPEGRAHAV